MNNIRLSNLKYAAAPLAIGLALISTPSFAQNADEDTASNPGIVVTGSRIVRPDLESTSPVTVVGSEEIAATGTTRIEDLVNTLPSVVGGQNSFISNGASGTATVDLRGIGTTRTLVLVNGRRLQPGDPTLPVADLNQIPAALVERVEVSTGGASAVYGADAVAGVVNFVMKTDFEGIQLNSQYGFYQHSNRNKEVVDTVGGSDLTIRDRMDQRGFSYPTGNVVDGQQWDTNLTIGGNFGDGRGNFVGYLGYRQVNPILQGSRDHSSCALSRSASSNRVTCGGSATAPNATIADLAFGDIVFGTAQSDGSIGPYGGAYNYAPINYFQRPNKRWTAGFFGNYEINDNIDVYAEFMFMDSRTVAQIAQSGTFFNQYDIACNSPLLSAATGASLCSQLDTAAAQTAGLDSTAGDGIVSLLIGKRNVEGGARRDDLRHTTYRALTGARGEITGNWRYDVSLQYGTTVFQETYFNDLSSSRLAKALNAVNVGGNIVCAVNADAISSNDDAACAPYNPFWGQGIVTNAANGITQAAIDYVNVPGFQRGTTEEYIASGYVTGELGSIGNASPIGLVLGTEYRKVQIDRSVDAAFATGDLAGQGGPQQNINGEFSVKELFTELLVPIVEDAPFAKSLSLELGYRYSDYTSIGSTHTYKILGEWSPIDALKFRGGYNRSVRAPNVVELFSPNVIGLWGGSDPCAGATPTFTAAQCANTGATNYGGIAASPADQYNQIGGGNPNLFEETADSWTGGVVIDGSSFLPGFTATVDYFNINIKDAIQGIGAQTILNTCGLTGDAFFCSLIQRDPVSQNLWVGNNAFITNTQRNIGGQKVDGIDVGVNYSRELGSGRVSLNMNGTWYNSFRVDTGVVVPAQNLDGKYDCVGLHGSVCGTPLPEWRHTARLGYSMDNGIGLSVRWRYVGAVKTDGNNPDADLGGSVDPRSDISAQNYFDLTTDFDINDTFSITAGVNNIFDRDPPLVDGRFSSNANTYVEVYDPAGRYVFVGAKMNF
ncbi:hypothetical protein LPB140_04535 [Sphingorhabdus lutea]|uniref:TonB-dependent receptor n=1 Tax=Sphingorhabdus lutea TaxID=1913578 RepID=A0A1L3JAN2_9SPHN|nr:TonB-dependent receptor [Sphingorhabdus lutea]APG62194.1 hypothetical protein LPB140_04535 [Sphingorhabdus lutea]